MMIISGNAETLSKMTDCTKLVDPKHVLAEHSLQEEIQDFIVISRDCTLEDCVVIDFLFLSLSRREITREIIPIATKRLTDLMYEGKGHWNPKKQG